MHQNVKLHSGGDYGFSTSTCRLETSLYRLEELGDWSTDLPIDRLPTLPSESQLELRNIEAWTTCNSNFCMNDTKCTFSKGKHWVWLWFESSLGEQTVLVTPVQVPGELDTIQAFIFLQFLFSTPIMTLNFLVILFQSLLHCIVHEAKISPLYISSLKTGLTCLFLLECISLFGLFLLLFKWHLYVQKINVHICLDQSQYSYIIQRPRLAEQAQTPPECSVCAPNLFSLPPSGWKKCPDTSPFKVYRLHIFPMQVIH